MLTAKFITATLASLFFACALGTSVNAHGSAPKPQVSGISLESLSASDVIDLLAALDEEDEELADIMRLETIGTSVDGLGITLVRLGSNPAAPCVYVICRQHGDEPAPTEAALNLIENFVHNEDQRALLEQVTLCIVPVANPDAADSFRRNNHAGVNLNRDWGRLSQPETSAIRNSIKACKPKLIVDAHENYAWEKAAQYIQPGRTGSATTNRFLSSLCSAIRRDEVRAGHSMSIAAASAGTSGLAHRSFSVKGIPSVLVESKQTNLGVWSDMNRRQRLHQVAILTALQLVAKKY